MGLKLRRVLCDRCRQKQTCPLLLAFLVLLVAFVDFMVAVCGAGKEDIITKRTQLGLFRESVVDSRAAAQSIVLSE